MPNKNDEVNESALKHLFDKHLLKRISISIAEVYPAFDQKNFLALIPKIALLEMKPRVLLIRDALKAQLPTNYQKALSILLNSLKKENLSGFDLWPYTEFVQTYGLNELQISLAALKKMTPLFTSEWGIRPFIKTHPKETMKFLLECAADSNEAVRRWASEGSRPRLPWGERLQDFVRDPSPTLPILEKLKFDSSLYVRKSVSNHLNDIAKDHPDLVIQLLQKWQMQAGKRHLEKIEWIIRRSLRTLIKQGHREALRLIGVSTEAKIKLLKFNVKKNKIKLGDPLDFEISLISSSQKSQKLVVDYIVHFMKANKSTAPKIFKLKTFELKSKENLVLSKSHHLKKITTRDYYPGRHFLEIQINGKVLGKISWHLDM